MSLNDLSYSELHVDQLLVWGVDQAAIFAHGGSIWNVNSENLSWEAVLEVVLLDHRKFEESLILWLADIWGSDELRIYNWLELDEVVVRVEASDQTIFLLGVKDQKETAALFKSVSGSSSSSDNELTFM